MIIVGRDYHPSLQQIAFVDTETGERKEQRLMHREGAEKVYRTLAAMGQRVNVGMEASGHARWFERLLAELRTELKWEMRPRYGASAGVNRRRIGRMGSIFWACCERTTFRQYGFRAGRIGICGNCCGIATGWCKRARASAPLPRKRSPN